MTTSITPIAKIAEITDTFVEQYNELIVQLSRDPRPVSKAELLEIQERSDSELLMCALQDGRLVGIVQGTYSYTPPMYRVYINNVVVDESQRGQGLGSTLMHAVMETAQAQWPKMRRFVLTNSPRRGNEGFYLKLGFESHNEASGNPTTVFTKEIQ